jgi:DNA-binding SARP family transcriptional activator
MFRVRTLGGLRLEAGEGSTGGSSRGRSLALLALVAGAGDAGITRDQLLAYLWPQSDTARARNSLKQVLFSLRQELQAEIFVTTNPVVRLDPRAVAADLQEFAAALDRHALADAVALYQGPFLDGFYLSGLADFEHWVETDRRRLAARYQKAMESLATGASAAGDTHGAVMWWRRVVAHDPLSSPCALALMRALVKDGDRVQALKYAGLHENLLRAELGLDPDTGEKVFVRQLRQHASAAGQPRFGDRQRSTRRRTHDPTS